MNEEENPNLTDQEKQANDQLQLVKQLAADERFRTWVEVVVKPGIAILEAEIASEKADQLPEVILRAKLKHINSLKFYFEDIFTLIK
jgi:hypothetical protein